MQRREAGQVLPLVALLLVAMGGAAVMLVRLGGLTAERAQASAAADAAALAGAAEGRDAADRLASANGGRVLAYRVEGSDTEVRVGVGQASATARATRTGGGGEAGDQAAALRAVLARAAQLLGRPVPVERLLDDGLTFDVAPGFTEALARVADQSGLCRPQAGAQPDRFRVCAAPAASGGEAVER